MSAATRVAASWFSRARRIGGERVLAQATSDDGTIVAGTRTALHVGERRIPWDEVEKADWDADEFSFSVTEVGTWGHTQSRFEAHLPEPGRIVELVRERVTASVVLQRHVPIRGRNGVRVIARRSPGGDEVRWLYEYDEGIDPDDPAVRSLAADALRQAQRDIGL